MCIFLFFQPEWYFTQVLNWIKNHSDFLEHTIQPILQRTEYDFVHAKVMCTRTMHDSNSKVSIQNTNHIWVCMSTYLWFCLQFCIVLMKQKASFVSASFNESRYKIQGFCIRYFSKTNRKPAKKKPKQCISSKTKSTCQNSTTSEHFQKWLKNQGVVLALSLSISQKPV